MIDFHDAGKNEAVDLRTQATNVGGEFERQHGHGAVGKIDAGAAQAGFLIKRGTGSHVVSDVGDVDLELEVAIAELAYGDGVVEIAGGFAVDGDDREIAEIMAGADFNGWGDWLNCFGCFQHFGGKAVRQMEFAD